MFQKEVELSFEQVLCSILRYITLIINGFLINGLLICNIALPHGNHHLNTGIEDKCLCVLAVGKYLYPAQCSPIHKTQNQLEVGSLSYMPQIIQQEDAARY